MPLARDKDSSEKPFHETYLALQLLLKTSSILAFHFEGADGKLISHSTGWEGFVLSRAPDDHFL